MPRYHQYRVFYHTCGRYHSRFHISRDFCWRTLTTFSSVCFKLLFRGFTSKLRSIDILILNIIILISYSCSGRAYFFFLFYSVFRVYFIRDCWISFQYLEITYESIFTLWQLKSHTSFTTFVALNFLCCQENNLFYCMQQLLTC